MPTFSPEKLRQIGIQLFTTAGCTPQDTHAVVDHLVTSNLFGHDSHGVIRFPEYLKALREGRFKAQATPIIVREHSCTAVVDANGALGQVGANFAMNLAIEKANNMALPPSPCATPATSVVPVPTPAASGTARIDWACLCQCRASGLSDCAFWRAGWAHEHQPDCLCFPTPQRTADHGGYDHVSDRRGQGACGTQRWQSRARRLADRP